MNAVGIRRQNTPASPTMIRNTATQIGGRLITESTAPTEPCVARANSRLNQPKNPVSCTVSDSRSSIAHRAGVNVNATTPDSTTAITIVIANCLNSSPVTPPMNATGTNTEQSTSTIATSAL